MGLEFSMDQTTRDSAAGTVYCKQFRVAAFHAQSLRATALAGCRNGCRVASPTLLRGDERQEDFALRLGVTQSQLSKIERGALPPSVEVLIRLREISGKMIDWILTGKK